MSRLYLLLSSVLVIGSLSSAGASVRSEMTIRNTSSETNPHIHTHISTPLTAPASFLEDQRSYKLASVCFLGFGECGDDQGFNAGGHCGTMQKRGI